MYSINLPNPDDLKTLLNIFGVVVALPVAWLILWRLQLNRIVQRLDSLHIVIVRDLMRVTPGGVKKFIAMLLVYLLSMFAVGLPAELLANHYLTAKIAVVNADNTAFTRQVFTWDKEYGDLPGAGRFVVNRSADDLLLLDWKLFGPPQVAQSFPPASVTKVESLPQSYAPVAEGVKRPGDLSGDATEQCLTNETAYLQKLAEMQTDTVTDPAKNILLGID